MDKEKEKRKIFRVRKNLFPILKKVLIENKVQYYPLIKFNELFISTTGISGMQFRRFVEEALCIEQQGSCQIPVLSYSTIKNDSLRSKVLKNSKCSCYTVLKKDQEKVKQNIW